MDLIGAALGPADQHGLRERVTRIERRANWKAGALPLSYDVTSNSWTMPSVKWGVPSGSSPDSKASMVKPTGMKHRATVRPATRL